MPLARRLAFAPLRSRWRSSALGGDGYLGAPARASERSRAPRRGLIATYTVLRNPAWFADGGLILLSAAIDVEWTLVLRIQQPFGVLLSALVPNAQLVPAVAPEAMSSAPERVKEYVADPMIFHGEPYPPNRPQIAPRSPPDRPPITLRESSDCTRTPLQNALCLAMGGGRTSFWVGQRAFDGPLCAVRCALAICALTGARARVLQAT